MITPRCILYTKWLLHNLFLMSSGPMRISVSDIKKIREEISVVEDSGALIRRMFGEYNDDDYDIGWEVDAAVDAFSIFSSKWAIEILATLYIAGDRRFNEMRKLLRGISSRTLSDSSPPASRMDWWTGWSRTARPSVWSPASRNTAGRPAGC